MALTAERKGATWAISALSIPNATAAALGKDACLKLRTCAVSTRTLPDTSMLSEEIYLLTLSSSSLRPLLLLDWPPRAPLLAIVDLRCVSD